MILKRCLLGPVFILYAGQSSRSIKAELGSVDYSYFYVLDYYKPILESLGDVVVVTNPEAEVDAIYESAIRNGRNAFFLLFAPPQKAMLGLKCPIVMIFAWEYGTIPNEIFGGDERNDWTYVFSRVYSGITHSKFSQAAVEKAVDFPFIIKSIPAPVWEKYSDISIDKTDTNIKTIQINGYVVDSKELSSSGISSLVEDLDPKSKGLKSITLTGIVYTGVFNPNDGRKNWPDLLSSFVWAFREVEDVTLVLKLSYFDAKFAMKIVLHEINKLLPFSCRIVVLHGYLDRVGYRKLVAASHFTVNSAHGEGQCLPLMEFMSAGVPAVAPNHTAMKEYIFSSNSFVVESSEEWTHWPHDPRAALRSIRYRINWDSMREAYLNSYSTFKSDPKRYLTMAQSARKDLSAYCGRKVVKTSLRSLFVSAENDTLVVKMSQRTCEFIGYSIKRVRTFIQRRVVR